MLIIGSASTCTAQLRNGPLQFQILTLSPGASCRQKLRIRPNRHPPVHGPHIVDHASCRVQMLHHIGTFPSRLHQHQMAEYDYVACPPVSYPELAEDIWCHRYYLRNLCNQEAFPEWPIVDHVQFLQVPQLPVAPGAFC